VALHKCGAYDFITTKHQHQHLCFYSVGDSMKDSWLVYVTRTGSVRSHEFSLVVYSKRGTRWPKCCICGL